MDGGTPSEGERPTSRAEQSKERLVDAAVELVVDHYDRELELRDVFSYLTPGSVAARAGLSRALLYHHWGDGDEGVDAFSAFLVEVADRLRARSSVPEDYERIADHLDGPSDVLLAMCDHELDRPGGLRSAWWRATQSLNLHGVVSAEQGQEVIGRLAAVYEVLGAHFELTPVEPLGWEEIAVAIASALNGFALTVREVPEHGVRRYDWTPRTPLERQDHEWTLLSIMVESLVLGMVRPLPGSSVQPVDNWKMPSESEST
jgi:AcrR family transcriptional regulator